MRVWIYMRSGQTVEFNAKEITKTRNRLTGELTSLNWKSAENGPVDLFDVNLADIVAITTEAIRGDQTEDGEKQ